MRSHCNQLKSRISQPGFTLIEMLVVIAIISVLMTAGAIGLGSMGGKGVTSAVASAESIFDEARGIAVGQRTYARVLVAKTLKNASEDNLKRIVIMSAKLKADGTPDTNEWELSSRGLTLPDQTFFSQDYSSKAVGTTSALPTVDPAGLKAAYQGTYYYYEFNPEGICTTGVNAETYNAPSFVVGSGARQLTKDDAKPRVTNAGKSDFGGFVIWRNGRTSVFRSPEQISPQIGSLRAGSEF